MTLTAASLLNTDGLQTGYRNAGKRTVVSGHLPELGIMAGRLICLLGPNGSGKSTLLRTLACLQPPLAGNIVITGQTGLSSAEVARRISMVLTDRVTGSNLNVYSLIALGRYPWSGWLGILTEADRAACGRAIATAGVGNLLDRKVQTLSDGENQKVMLARALAQDTPILMLDEPTAHLDLPSRIRLMRLLHRLARDTGKGILLSTHELDLALQVADEVWLLGTGGGLHKGVPEDLVLDGVFESAFAREDVVFDRATGVFMIHPGGGRPIVLEGVGMNAFWTRRALLREGFTMAEAFDAMDSAGVVRVGEKDGQPLWALQQENVSREFYSVAGLLSALRE
jgi:iron complex transport system ATP-binding protein